jgi:hypothetical protein
MEKKHLVMQYHQVIEGQQRQMEKKDTARSNMLRTVHHFMKQ